MKRTTTEWRAFFTREPREYWDLHLEDILQDMQALEDYLQETHTCFTHKKRKGFEQTECGRMLFPRAPFALTWSGTTCEACLERRQKV